MERGIKRRSGRRAQRLSVAALFAALLAMAVASGTVAAPGDPDTLGKTTLEQRIVPTIPPMEPPDAFRNLQLGPGETPHIVREELGTALPGRVTARESLLYFGQLSDFQLADEESPGRVESTDPTDSIASFLSSAWRPWEAMNPQIDDASVRQLNTFKDASPVADGAGNYREMDFSIMTGDNADSQQKNESEWVRTLLDGGTLDSNSGINPSGYTHQLCTPFLPFIPGGAEAAKYTGIQDYNDYFEGTFPEFWDPNSPQGTFAGFPAYPDLMDRAQQPFEAAGVDKPMYLAFGNHDGLVQGNAFANRLFEDVATGCIKPTGLLPGVDPNSLASVFASITPANILLTLATDPTKLMFVPPDPDRQNVDKKQYIDIFRNGQQDDGYGFDFIDPAVESGSGGNAGYYDWSPQPGFRFIALDTVSEGGVIGPSADGNIDDPQFQWLASKLAAAEASDELVVLFSHHAIPSLTASVPDELAPPCVAGDGHGHDINPGCDRDTRLSVPIRLGGDLEGLLHQHPNVLAWVAGHSHVNDVTPYPDGSGGGFWSIRTAAEADWPQQPRLLEIMDNTDGTLSIFGTILDHASNATAPGAGTDADTLDEEDLASIGRTISYNDPQSGGRACSGGPCGQGAAEDRNVELLIDDPRNPDPGDADLSITKSDSPDPVTQGEALAYTLSVHNDGPSSASNVVVTDALPSGLTFQPSPGCVNNAGTVTCDLGDIANGDDASATINVTPTQAGTVTNSASVDSDTGDSDGSDNSDTESTTVEAASGPPGGGGGGGGTSSLPCSNVIRGDSGRNRLVGTAGGDSIIGLAGKDRLFGLGADDCLIGGTGKDRLSGGAGNDNLRGNGGRDRLNGGTGNDLIKGGPGNDRINARRKGRDVVRCGKGVDRATVSGRDKTAGCEIVIRR